MTQRFEKPAVDAREAEIQRMIAADPDTAEATDAELAEARPFAVVFPDLMASIGKERGRPALERPRRQISIRLDPEVIEKFRATGKGWQSRINEVLRNAKP
ncbi:MAG: BrnA antitoxin family protein [Rhizobiaceae bacterium]|nr:BrnA antitoxin family protein [Rhizobiaceae bacterium]